MRTWASVDFPEPFGPMMAWTSPFERSRSIPFRISAPSIDECRLRMTRSGNTVLMDWGLESCEQCSRVPLPEPREVCYPGIHAVQPGSPRGADRPRPRAPLPWPEAPARGRPVTRPGHPRVQGRDLGQRRGLARGAQLDLVAEPAAASGVHAAPGLHAAGRAHAPARRVALPWRVPAASGRRIS